MIIVIGKEDKALIADAQAYVRQAGDYEMRHSVSSYPARKRIKEDCEKIANRLLKAIGVKV